MALAGQARQAWGFLREIIFGFATRNFLAENFLPAR